MPRRITAECLKCGRVKEYVVGIAEKLRCQNCKSTKVEIIWDEPGPTGAPGFRIQGMTKRF